MRITIRETANPYHSELLKIKELYDTTVTHCREVQGKGVVFVIGKTGSGKSTTINFLAGVPLKQKIDEETDTIQIVADRKEEKHAPKIAIIGHEGSQTTYPAIFSPKWIHNFVYCDLAGFSDTRGDAYDANAYLSAQLVAQLAEAIKGIICVIDYDSLTAMRGLGFIELARLIKQIFLPKSFSRYFRDCVKFVITKVPSSITKAQVLTKIKKIGDASKLDAKDAEDLSYQIPEVILKIPDNLIILRPDDLVSSFTLRDEINNFFKTPRADILHSHLTFLQKSSSDSLNKILVGAAIAATQLLLNRESAISTIAEEAQTVERLENMLKEEKIAQLKSLEIADQQIKKLDTQIEVKMEEIKSVLNQIEKVKLQTPISISESKKLIEERICREIKEVEDALSFNYIQQLNTFNRLIEQFQNDRTAYKTNNSSAGDSDPVLISYRNSIQEFEDKKMTLTSDHTKNLSLERERIKQKSNSELIEVSQRAKKEMETELRRLESQILDLERSKVGIQQEKENSLKESQQLTESQNKKLESLKSNLRTEQENLERAQATLKEIEETCRSQKIDFDIIADLDKAYSFNYDEVKKFILIYQRYKASKITKAPLSNGLFVIAKNLPVDQKHLGCDFFTGLLRPPQ